MTTNLLMLIEKQEKKITSQINSQAIKLIESTIINGITTTSNDDIEFLLKIVKMQTAIELIIKHYIIETYGFTEILGTKITNMKKQNLETYYKEIMTEDIHTLGFHDCIQLLENKGDSLTHLIKGSIDIFTLKYNTLDGVVDKFNRVRNSFIHLGRSISLHEQKIMNSEIILIIHYFIPLVLCRLDGFSMTDIIAEALPSNYLNRALSKRAFNTLINNDLYISEVIDLTNDLHDNDFFGQIQSCPHCKNESLGMRLEIDWDYSHCFTCGTWFYANYADCQICSQEMTVIYDHLNIEINNNQLKGYCCACQNYLTVFKCPVCGLDYSFDYDLDTNTLFDDCCIKSYKKLY